MVIDIIYNRGYIYPIPHQQEMGMKHQDEILSARPKRIRDSFWYQVICGAATVMFGVAIGMAIFTAVITL